MTDNDKLIFRISLLFFFFGLLGGFVSGAFMMEEYIKKSNETEVHNTLPEYYQRPTPSYITE